MRAVRRGGCRLFYSLMAAYRRSMRQTAARKCVGRAKDDCCAEAMSVQTADFCCQPERKRAARLCGRRCRNARRRRRDKPGWKIQRSRRGSWRSVGSLVMRSRHANGRSADGRRLPAGRRRAIYRDDGRSSREQTEYNRKGRLAAGGALLCQRLMLHRGAAAGCAVARFDLGDVMRSSCGRGDKRSRRGLRILRICLNGGCHRRALRSGLIASALGLTVQVISSDQGGRRLWLAGAKQRVRRDAFWHADHASFR